MLKTFLTIIVSTLLLTNLTGCANGNTKDPLKPVGVKSQTDNKLSTVVFYRSDDSFGSLDFGEITAKVDDVSVGIMSEDSNPNFYLEASRSEYMSNTYMPGIHSKHICQAYKPGIHAWHPCHAYARHTYHAQMLSSTFTHLSQAE